MWFGLLAGCGGSTSKTVALGASSWDVSALVTEQPSHGGACPPRHLAMRFDPAIDGWVVISSDENASIGGRPIPDVVVGAVGSAPAFADSTRVTVTTIPTGDATWALAGPTQELTRQIPGTGDDIVLLVSSPACFDSTCPPTPAILIDDLRAE